MAPSQHWREVLIIVPLVGTAVATIVYVLRVYARHIVTQKLRIEDLLMGIGLFFTWGVAGCIVYAAIHGIGIGQTILVLPREERVNIALADWILQKFWPMAQVLVKVSIILFLRRLLECLDRFRLCATLVIILVVAWGVTAIIGNIFQCWPVQYFWVKRIRGHCMPGQNTFFIIIGSLSVAQDVLILCLPLPVVWRLHAPLRDKLEITLLFSIGCIVCIFSIFRLVALKNFQTDNLTINSSFTLIWTVLELDVAIICGSLLLMKPFFQSCIRRVRKSITRLNSGPSSRGSSGTAQTAQSTCESGVSDPSSQKAYVPGQGSCGRMRLHDSWSAPLDTDIREEISGD
ncbi:hypothetical protein N7532_000948 [Penicillium argentinense]|uniref:Rhodopsin domain-containing protein n=1 Tax=Penicillium argentinense TaxID=1131581 RepID=A0A9W9KLZ6_9EURO|nr:uncharacterized protein N7532_000948 [Penicillium argentinense]KAJ5110413.1 hypothetical protein N7532_000948 [Penicillium argentinense]